MADLININTIIGKVRRAGAPKRTISLRNVMVSDIGKFALGSLLSIDVGGEIVNVRVAGVINYDPSFRSFDIELVEVDVAGDVTVVW